ncbi:T9SS type A sorting domain-containing protein [Aquimarina sp. MMG015]|uniref:extracellular catalytic domain type 1 short-chain-length polyhydroxyalkanoate depolymerase n=1 Tax=Aquimarina sp. MMG015 TaxID=2822689 RepID=UPI001B3A0440|nr:T9SS type A sorting domain-containing protein [Aquimarina sp. MMG015]MBQ4804716.1 T9SS type A sorting domain-containing protein [Aquimarina sp. MMG015]
MTDNTVNRKKFLRIILITSWLLFIVSITGNAQQTINGSIEHDGLTRDYILYVPAIYSSDKPAPLVFNFHGYTSNANDQMFYGDFRSIADTEGFLIVHPMGTVDNSGNTHFNVGWGTSAIDDVGYTEALIDEISSNYTINAGRIYSTGMSNGGFMSYKLACELSERIAAIASVTGTMNKNQPATCNPSHQIPVMEIHGTSDPTVPYEGANWIESTPDVMSFWANFNNCETSAEITNLPDTAPNDGSTVEYQVFKNGDNGARVEHYKINNGGHKWPGSNFNSSGTNYDIDASALIWDFFSKYDINGEITTLSIAEVNGDNRTLRIHPNPVGSIITVDLKIQEPLDYSIFTIEGKLTSKGTISITNNTIDVSHLVSSTIYFLNIGNTSIKIQKK